MTVWNGRPIEDQMMLDELEDAAKRNDRVYSLLAELFTVFRDRESYPDDLGSCRTFAEYFFQVGIVRPRNLSQKARSAPLMRRKI